MSMTSLYLAAVQAQWEGHAVHWSNTHRLQSLVQSKRLA